MSRKFPDKLASRGYSEREGFTGRDVAAAVLIKTPEFPNLLAPKDDLAPATMVTSVKQKDGRLTIRGVSHDNGTIASVTINGAAAKITAQQAGVAEWTAEFGGGED